MPSCRDAALAALGRRALTRKELVVRLRRKGFAADEIDRVVSTLVGKGLVDDARTAEAHVRSRGVRGVGKRRVAAELAARGVPEADRSNALAGIDGEEERVRLRAALVRRDAVLPARLTGRERSRKLFDHLVRRGFSPDAVLEELRRKGQTVDDHE
jgi:regulatory protein